MSRLGRIVLLTVLTVAATLAWAAPASAIYHLVKVREVSPETSPSANNAFVELQMYFPGQNNINTHTLRFYNAAGTAVSGRLIQGDTPDADPPNGQSQRTILIGDDRTPGYDLFVNDMSDEPNFSAAGGAICFDFTLVDCVSWGTFNNSGPMADIPVGTNAPAIPSGMSLTRSISRGCATLLENGDDTDNSTADFSVTARTPRPNSTPPTETACAPPADTVKPRTFVTNVSVNSRRRRARIRFRGTDNRAGPITFQCKIDGNLYSGCQSPKVYRRLSVGRHVFRVRARDAAGNIDATAVRRVFRVFRVSARR